MGIFYKTGRIKLNSKIMKNFFDFKKAIDEIEKSEGYRIDTKSFELENSFKIMVINYGFLEDITKNITTFSVDEKDKQHIRMIECTRCFVNFLCSAVAFKDHFRKYITKVYGSTEVALDGKYQQKICEEFAGDSITGFIEALRNIYAHDSVPPVGFQANIVDGRLVTRFVLFLEKLDIDSDLFSKGKKFIESEKGEFVDAQEICFKYISKTIFPWLMVTQSEFHKKDFENLETLKQRARDIMGNKDL